MLPEKGRQPGSCCVHFGLTRDQLISQLIYNHHATARFAYQLYTSRRSDGHVTFFIICLYLEINYFYSCYNDESALATISAAKAQFS